MSKRTDMDITTDYADRQDWRESSFSDGTGTCLSVARLDNGNIAIRNSNHPDDGTLTLSRDQFARWLGAIAAGQH